MKPDLSRNVTYLLGAGASYNALPVVNEMAGRLRQLAINLEVCNHPLAKETTEDFIWLADLHDKYFTIDTVAKIFYHKSATNLLRLKKVVSIYFFMEQWFKDLKNDFRPKPQVVDNRYFRLIAYFLGSSKLASLPGNLNFISWNYDMQLELALHDFFHTHTLTETLNDAGVLPRSGKYLRMVSGYNEAKIIHLNGLACLVSNLHGTGEHILNLFDLFEEDQKNDLERFFERLKDLYDKHGFESSYFLSFAWEEDKIAKQYFNRAQELMSTTQDLVVIGYSFPNFNRTIDNDLVKSFSENNIEDKRVFIQDPILRRDEAFKLIYPDFENVFQETSKEEFFIPPGV